MISNEISLGNDYVEGSKAKKKIGPEESEPICVDEWFP